MLTIRRAVLQRPGGQDQEPRRQQVGNLGPSRRRVVRGRAPVLSAAIDPDQSRHVIPSIAGIVGIGGIGALRPKIPLAEKRSTN